MQTLYQFKPHRPNEVIFLNESPHIAFTRYMGPYACAAEVRKRGIDAVVFDFFTRAECDFFDIFFRKIHNSFYSDWILSPNKPFDQCWF